MSFTRWLVIGGLVGLFLFAKVWVLRHPVSMIAIVIGATLLIFSESAEAT